MQLTALTELDAVNSIIGTIGEAPINSLEELTDVDAIVSCGILVDRNSHEDGLLTKHHTSPLTLM